MERYERNFTEEQRIFRQGYRNFLEREIVPNLPAWRKSKCIHRSAFEKAGALGYLMVWPDEQYGGWGDKDFRYEQIIIEELGRVECLEFYASLHSRIVGPYIDKFGTAEQKQRFLPKAVAGTCILAIAMTEPGAGSDLASMRSTLVEQGDAFVLNGSKTYISNGLNADAVIVAAKSDPDNNPHALTICIVERGMEGFERGKPLDKIGLHAQDTCELFFNNVRIPKDNILGKVGKGFYYLMDGLAEERLMAAVMSLTNAHVAFHLTREYVMSRKAFGKTIADLQNTQFRMAEMDAEIEILQVFIDHCVAGHNNGQLTANKAAKAKLQCSEVEWKMLDLGVQLHGGSGFMEEYRIGRMFRDNRVNRIYAGTSEIMKLIIGRDVFSDGFKSFF